jgi:hypothetical protein
VELIRDTAEAKHEISKIYNWYRGLEAFIKPEEDALIAAKVKRRYDRLERTKNMQFDPDAAPPVNKAILLGRGKRAQTVAKGSPKNRDLKGSLDSKQKSHLRLEMTRRSSVSREPSPKSGGGILKP